LSFLSKFFRGLAFQHKRSKKAIKQDRIIAQNASGIVESVDNGWVFTPAAEVDTVTTEVTGPYETPPIPQVPAQPAVEQFNSPQPVATATDLKDVSKTTYFFGIDEIASRYRLIHKTCGVVFDNITIGRCSFIELAAAAVTNDNCSVEFYIIDGTKEIPILPVSCEQVVNEKLFFNMNPRFSIDTKKDVTIKKDGQIVKRIVGSLSELDLQNGLYTIDYTPIDAHRYYPENETISVKVVQRLYSETAEPSYITNMLIRKYGGGIPWTE